MPKASLENFQGPSFAKQFLGTLKLGALLRLRFPISSLFEMLLPFIFVLCTVFLSLVIHDRRTDSQGYLDYRMMEMALHKQEELFSALCYDPNMTGESIDGLASCRGGENGTMCFGHSHGIPVNGICLQGIKQPHVFVSDMLSFIMAYGYLLMPVPSFDDIVKIHWLIRCAAAIRGDFFFDSITRSGWLYVTPRNAQAESMVAYLNQSALFKYVFARYFDSNAEADAYFHNHKGSVKDWGLIVLNDVSTDPAKPFLDVSLRLGVNAVPITSSAVDYLYDAGRSSFGGSYILSGFITLQTVVYEHFMDKLRVPIPERPFIAPMMTVAFVTKTFLKEAGILLSLMTVLGFLFSVSQSVKRIVLDKELRIREALLIMGLRRSAQYVAWFFLESALHAVVSLMITVLLKLTYMKNSSIVVMFFLFFLFSLSSIALSGLIATFFSKSRLASVLSPAIFFAFAAPLFAVSRVSSGVLSAFCIFSPSAFGQGAILLFSHEAASGFGYNDFASSSDSPNMLFVFSMLIFDTIFYLVLMMYFDAVIPNDWGTPRHPFFCILDLFSRRRPQKTEFTEEDTRDSGLVFEPLTEEERSKSAVRICGLTKFFKRGKETFAAVDHMHWDLIEGDISVLLGHNGAGKTTAMNLMTGMLQPDEGDCFIYGHSVRTDLSRARQEIGFCPQHNILWPELTCYEHLEYLSTIKGLWGEARKEAIETMLGGVDLQEKRDCRSSQLSAGQKRKLSVAIAFIGNSRLVFLDEPTAGMDVEARRHTCELLRQMSAGRAILLSTHFMDEADLLGDRIAIMNAGRLQCAGSGLFIKSNFGMGYNMTLSLTHSADLKVIRDLVHSHIPPAKVLSCAAGEMSFQLPKFVVKDFSKLLDDIERSGSLYGIQHYTLSVTTLEEIFFSLANVENVEVSPDLAVKREMTEDNAGGGKSVEAVNMGQLLDSADSNKEDNNSSAASKCLSSIWDAPLFQKESDIVRSQLKASMKKRLFTAIRDRRTVVLQIIFPLLMISLTMLLSMVNLVSYFSLILSSNMYGEPVDIDLAGCHDTINTSNPFARNARSIIHDDLPNPMSLSNYYLTTYYSHSVSRYAGLACKGSPNSGAATLFFNFSSLHASALGVVGYYGALVQKTLSPASAPYSEDIFLTRNHPFVPTGPAQDHADFIKCVVMGTLIALPFLFLPSTYVSSVVRERQCRARHLQNVLGLRFSVYWLSNYIFDLCSYFITMLLVLILMVIFQSEEYISGEALPPFFLLLVVYGFTCVAASYALSFLFKEHSSAQNCVLLINLVTGFVLLLLTVILRAVPATKSLGGNLTWVFRVFPGFCFADGVVNLANPQHLRGPMKKDTLWSLDVVGYSLIFLSAEAVVFFLITLIVDAPAVRMRRRGWWRSCGKTSSLSSPDGNEDNSAGAEIKEEDEEEDVAAERRRVMQEEGDQESTDLVRVVGLRKVYDNGKVAVRNLTFGVQPGEVFGFLGTNGAGKTTTIAVLCQEIAPTSGHAVICGSDILKNPREALQYIGYCPQFDALLSLLTVEEQLQLYAGIRGVMPQKRKRVVRALMDLWGLTVYRKTRSGDLSGGNRRKLLVAISLIGGPRVVFLDEPSAGMDPVARRGLWTAIQSLSDSCAVVLTTHHLEEVEVLAHRVAIMVNGTLRCVGGKEHLRQKYGSGFEMTIRRRGDVPESRLEEFVVNHFPAARLNEVRGQRHTYALPDTTPLSEVFRLLERHREDAGVVDYAISQTSMEQVFLRVAAEGGSRGTHVADDSTH